MTTVAEADSAPVAGSSLLKKKEVCRLLNACPRTLEFWMKQGRIAFLRIGRSIRFTPEHIEQFKAAHAVPVAVEPASTTP